jgi:catechol 2,3-dioxygenase-like lactoylglutathione lyase family enzyme
MGCISAYSQLFDGATQLKIRKIDHVSINVIDIEKSIDFYSRILGLQKLQTVDCGEFDITYFALPDGSRLELFDYHGKNHANPREESEVGLRHIAFQVENVAEHEKLLRATGVEITLATCDLPNLDARVLLFLDPNGVTLEFCEKLYVIGQ